MAELLGSIRMDIAAVTLGGASKTTAEGTQWPVEQLLAAVNQSYRRSWTSLELPIALTVAGTEMSSPLQLLFVLDPSKLPEASTGFQRFIK